MPEAGVSRIFSLRRAKDFDHLKVGQPGRGVHGKDELGKEPEPEGGRSKARQRADKGEVEDDDNDGWWQVCQRAGGAKYYLVNDNSGKLYG